MANYSITDSIIVWTDNVEVKNYTRAIAKELKLNVFEPDKISDLMAVPCFLKIFDAKYFDVYRELGGSRHDYFFYDDSKIAIYGKTKTDMLWLPKDLIDEIPVVLSKKYLHKLIKQHLDYAIEEDGYRKEQFKRRIFRIMSLYHSHIQGGNINIEKVSFRFDVDPRTVRRDLEVLKIIDPKIDFTFEKDGNLTSGRAPKKSSKAKTLQGLKVSNLRDIKFKSWVKRLICFYRMLHKPSAINVVLNCKKFSITDRSLRRDIKLLREINPGRKISFDKVKGYY